MAPPRPQRGPRPGGRGKPAGGKSPGKAPGKSPGKAPGKAHGRPPGTGERKPPRRSTGDGGERDARSNGRPRRDDQQSRSQPRGQQRGGQQRGRGRPRRPDPSEEAPREWGGLARKAVGRLRDDRPSKASEAWRRAAGEAPAEQAIWERIDDEPGGTGSGLRGEAGAAVRRGRRPAPERAAPSARPDGGEDPIAREATATGVPRFAQRLAEASRAFERDRFTEARGLLRPLAQRAPGSAPVRELYGLTLYRLGQWAAATRELEAFAELTGSAEQHPVLADCARALKRWDRVEELWRELKSASPSAALVAEGRIVMAGALADQGRLSDAIALLEPAVARQPKKLREHHLRLLYALADLRERAGEVPAARSLFRRIRDVAPDFADVSDRLRALG